MFYRLKTIDKIKFKVVGGTGDFLKDFVAEGRIKTISVPAIPDLNWIEFTQLEFLISLYNELPDEDKILNRFMIPKRSGGMREIIAPKVQVRKIQKKLSNLFQCQFGLTGTSAYAYVKNRNCKKAMWKHKNSNFFVHIDIKDFFCSCREKDVVDAFGVLNDRGLKIIRDIVHISAYNGTLYQGSALSPYLSNVVMSKPDLIIRRYCNREKLIYTRYADDIVISSKHSFDIKAAISVVKDAIKPLGMQINESKTKVTRNYGKNFHLGLTVNQNHDVTIGHELKRRIKAGIERVKRLKEEGDPHFNEAYQKLRGEVVYLEYIEPEYYRKSIKEKFDSLK